VAVNAITELLSTALMTVKGVYVVWKEFTKVLDERPVQSSYPNSESSTLLSKGKVIPLQA
jgi:hypothetical protein